MSVSSIPSMAVRSVLSSSVDSKPKKGAWFHRQVTRNLHDFRSVELWQACFAELLGTFFLAFFTIGVGIRKDGDEPPPVLQVALGAAFFVTVIITSLTTVSGGHVNPAISIGFLVANQITFIRFLAYTLFQMVGAVAGTAALKAILPPEYRGTLGLISKGEGVPASQALAMEAMITCLLLFCTLAFVDKHRKDVQGSVPYMVGLTVCVNILTAAKVSGGCMNPARALGPALVVSNMESQWIYWVGPLVGGAVGALLYDSFFSTRPLRPLARAIDRSKAGAAGTPRSPALSDDSDSDEMQGLSDNIKLNNV